MSADILSVIRSVIHETPPPPFDPSLLPLATRHSVQNLLAIAYPSELSSQYDLMLAQSETQLCAVDQMISCFESKGIYSLLLKGVCTKYRYPETYFRSMSDVDILYQPEQTALVRESMAELGYRGFEEGRKHDHFSMPPFVSVEMHRSLTEPGTHVYDCFADVWKRSHPKAGYRYCYVMTLEDEYLFHLVHMAEHIKLGGCGIRFVLDVYVYEHTKMDKAYVENTLQQLDLYEFYGNIRRIAEHWFGEDPDSYELNMIQEKLADYILGGGLFGTAEQAAALTVARGRVSSFFSVCFPKYASMQSMFPWLKKYPLLLPYSWLLRGFRAVRYRRRNIKSKFFLSRTGDKQKGKELKAFYEECGLK